MKIHEYQAKQLLREAGVAVPPGVVATSPEEADAAFRELGGNIAVVKAQIHAGGRGKGTIKDNLKQHGVQLVKSPQEAAEVAGRLLGHELVTIQTGSAGQTVRRVLIECAWCYRYSPRMSRDRVVRCEDQPQAIRDLAWKAQLRLCSRYRKLSARGVHQNKVCVAIARELAAFVWDVARQVPVER